jgi:hypothetical protein
MTTSSWAGICTILYAIKCPARAMAENKRIGPAFNVFRERRVLVTIVCDFLE